MLTVLNIKNIKNRRGFQTCHPATRGRGESTTIDHTEDITEHITKQRQHVHAHIDSLPGY